MGPFTVYIIDDDASVRSGLLRLMRSHDLRAQAYANPQSFIESLASDASGCVLLNINLPDMTNLQLPQQMAGKGIRLPVIAVSVENDDRTRRATRALGASFLLHKPVDDQALIDAIFWVSGSSDAEMRSAGNGRAG